MKITHVLQSGEVLTDISNYVINREDNPEIYNIIETIRKKERRNDEKEDKE